MSRLPDLGHLYHDSSISSNAVVLDAREYLRTREINAREQRHLEQLTKYLDRAKSASDRVQNHERQELRQRLRLLHIKTPTIEKGLQRETERLRRQLLKLRERTGQVSKTSQSARVLAGPRSYEDRIQTAWSPDRLTSSSEKLSSSSPYMKSPRGKFNKPSPSMYSSCGSPDSRKTLCTSSLKSDRTFYLKKSDSISQPRSTKSSSANFMKRSDQVMKALHKLYKRLIEREQKEKGKSLPDILNSSSKDILERARVVLGQKAADEMLTLFAMTDRKDSNTELNQHNVSSVSLQRNDSDDDGDVTDAELSSSQGPLSRISATHTDSHSANNKNNNNSNKDSGDDAILHDLGLTQEKDGTDQCVNSGKVQFSGTGKSNPRVSSKESSPRTKKFDQRADSMNDILRVLEADLTLDERGHGERSFKRRTQLSASMSLWQQPTGHVNRSRSSPKGATVVTLTGKHRRTLLRR